MHSAVAAAAVVFAVSAEITVDSTQFTYCEADHIKCKVYRKIINRAWRYYLVCRHWQYGTDAGTRLARFLANRSPTMKIWVEISYTRRDCRRTVNYTTFVKCGKRSQVVYVRANRNRKKMCRDACGAHTSPVFQKKKTEIKKSVSRSKWGIVLCVAFALSYLSRLFMLMPQYK